MVIIFDFTNLGGAWALSIFGFITIPLSLIPFVLYVFGPRLRARSKFSGMTAAEDHMMMMLKETNRESMQA